MAKKNNIRSIRISDDIAALIEQQAGNNFTEKWENLVTRCIWELPHKEQELAAIQQQIDFAKSKLRNLETERKRLTEISHTIHIAHNYMERLEQLAQDSNTN